MLDRMHSVGCIGIYCGVETGSKRMQKETNKNLDIDKSSEIIKYAEEAQIKCMLSFVYGFPQERYEDVIDTLKLINRLMKYGVKVAHPKVLKPVKGSPIYNEYPLFSYNKNVYNQRNIMLLKEFSRYDNPNSIDTYLENMIATYSQVFSYYYVYKPEILSVNTLLALGIIISSDNFSISEKLLLEVQDFDYIEMLKSFDMLSLQEDIRTYENHYIVYLYNEGKRNEIVNKIYEIAKYEKDKLEFKRLINSKFSQDNMIVKAYKYRYKVDKINGLKDYYKLEDLPSEESYYLFYFSHKSMTLKVFAINMVLYNFTKQYLEDADTNEMKQILENREVKNIPLLSLIFNDLNT